MAIVVIGGQTRNVGKTSVVCGLISTMPERHWTAIKISQHWHGGGLVNNDLYSGQAVDRSFAISEESDPTAGKDSSRYLAAGALRSLWIRTGEGQLAEAVANIRAVIGQAENVILESDSILRFLKPDIYAVVIDPEIADFKASALQHLERADAILLCSAAGRTSRKATSLGTRKGIPQFRIAPPNYHSSEFAAFVERRLEAAGK